jgi:hypothetical protein
MKKQPPTYVRRKFTLRWRGRRWYDPNERKAAWSVIATAMLAFATRLVVMGLSSTQSTQLAAAATSPAHGIIGTAHDLSSRGLYKVTQSTEVCMFCHTPHDAIAGIQQAIPIWNHTNTSTQFVMYTSATLKGDVDAQPMGPSLACLSCHDGSVAMGSLHEAPEGGGNTDYSHAQGNVNPGSGLIQGASQVGRDLSSIHPISVTYRNDLDKSLRPPAELVGVRLYPSNVQGARMHCGSCHDPHNFGDLGGTAPFLRVTTQGSSLCLSCHLM